MALFDNPEERARREKLKALENKRLSFLEEAKSRGFHPEKMVLAAGEESQLIGLARQDGDLWLVVAPAFGAEGEYRLLRAGSMLYDVETHSVAPEGMGGFFGFGKKGQEGVRFALHTEDGDVTLPLIAGLNTAALYGKKNPLLDEKRRRGDANVVWDLPPIDKRGLERLRREVERMLEGTLG